MRPIPVPDKVREQSWCVDTHVFAAPDGDLLSEEIPPAEGFLWIAQDGDRQYPVLSVMILLEDEDIEMIKNGARHLVIGWPGNRMPVFMTPEFINLEAL